MGAAGACCVEHRDCVFDGVRLRVGLNAGRDCGRGIPARRICDASVLTGKPSDLGFPAAVVPGALMDEEQWRALAVHFVVELDVVGALGLQPMLSKAMM